MHANANASAAAIHIRVGRSSSKRTFMSHAPSHKLGRREPRFLREGIVVFKLVFGFKARLSVSFFP